MKFKNTKNKYIIFTICFGAIVIPYLYKITINKEATISCWDAVTQMYPVMMYISRVLKEFFTSLFSGQEFAFSMWEWTLGMGDDVFSALNWHGFGDPFFLLTALISEEWMPYFYSFLYYLRVFCGGLAFLAFVHEIDDKRSDFAYVIGTLVYCFTGFTLVSNMHSIFTHAMVYIPLMLLGAERAMKGKRKGLLSISVLCFALSGFFFLYIGSIALGIYVLYRLIEKRVYWKESLRIIGILIAEYLIGLGISFAVFLPAVLGFLASDRTGVVQGIRLVMPLQDIFRLFGNIFFPQYNNEQVLSVSVIGIISIVCVCFSRKTYMRKINISVLLLLCMMPVISCIMSGFGKVYDRWELVVNMYFAYLTVEVWDEYIDLKSWQKAVITVLYLIMGLIGAKLDILENQQYRITILSYGIILFGILIILPISKKINKRMIGQVLFFLIVIMTIGRGWRTVARSREIFYVQERNVVAELIEDDTEDFYRIDNERTFGEPRTGMNVSFLLQYPGISEYVSIENYNYIMAFPKWNTGNKNHNNGGLDQRAVLETLSAVKYYLGYSDCEEIVPYGFEKVKESEDGIWSLYKNQYTVPIAYTYDTVFDEKQYAEMNGLQKQQVMLQSAAIEGYKGNIPKVNNIESDIHQLNYSIKGFQNGGTIENGVLHAEAGAKLELDVELKAGCENYLFFDDVNDDAVVVEVEEGYIKYKEQTPYLAVNLGSVPNDMYKKVTVTFSKESNFTMDKMQLLYYGFEDYEKYTDALKRDTKGNVIVDTNRIVCNIELDTDKILCVATPYSTGWSAAVDGEKTHVYKMNDMFMGIEVPAGNHYVEFNYITPGIKVGLGISIGTLIVVIILNICKWRVMRRKEVEEYKV